MDHKQIVKELLIDSVKLNGFVKGVMDRILEPALQNIVDNTENKYDDMAKAALYPLLDAELKKLIDEHLDFAKIFKADEVA